MKTMNLFSTLSKSLGLFLILFLIIASCKKKEEPIPETQKANFELSNATINEGLGKAFTVHIDLEKAATEAGSVTISITNGTGVKYTTNYVTNPNGSSGSFEAEVHEGATSASFTVTPIDDTKENTERIITFTLTKSAGSIVLGYKKTFKLSITDNDKPTPLNFEAATGTVAENAKKALAVNLTLTAIKAGTFDVTYSSPKAKYTTDFTTTPDGATGTFTVNVDAAATSASFSVMPVDNSLKEADKIVTFTISNATGGVKLGQKTTFALTITNDDNDDTKIVKTFAEIKALYDGTADVIITEDWTIKGIVTSKNDAVTGKNLFIQDGTGGGIVLRWKENHKFAQGDMLTVSIKGAKISSYNNLVQITGELPLANGKVVSQNNTVTPEVITLAQLNSGKYQAKLVTIENVSFSGADGIKTFSGNNGNNDVTDGTTTVSVRVEKNSPFANDKIPLGTGSITGILGVYKTTNQILPQQRTDVFASKASATITVEQTLTDFGDVTSNTNSASQNYTVKGTTLTEDIVITTPAQFEVSLDDKTFGKTATVLAANAMAAPVKVYVRLSPTTGFTGKKEGNITHTSAGAVAQTIAISGTETAPGGATTLLFFDDFDYGTTAGDLVGLTKNWVSHSGTTPVKYIATSLSMTGYPSSGKGGAVTLSTSNSQDINRVFTEQKSGTIYFSALMSLSAVKKGDYFFHLNSTSFKGRVGAKDDGAGGVLFGIGASGSTLSYGTTKFALNTTYLVVASYNIDSGEAKLYILNAVIATEPAKPEATNTGKFTSISSVALRQSAKIPDVTMDGIRIATDWAGIMTK